MTMAGPTVLLIGGTSTGKTNFLARLWLKLSQRTGILKADRLPDDLSYLEGASRNLLQGAFAGHTPTGSYNLSEIPVYWSKGDKRMDGNIAIPDRSGEQWAHVYQDRIWPEDFATLLSTDTACLFFIRAQSPEHEPLIDIIRQAELFGINTNSSSVTSSAPATKSAVAIQTTSTALDQGTAIEEFEVPTEVVLVDLVQCMQHAFLEVLGSRHKPRIGFVVSAWDLVPPEFAERTPEDYVRFNFPMLHQYVEQNTSVCDCCFFGSSVAGGDFDEDPSFKDSYLQADPFSAGYVVRDLNGARDLSDDFTVPIAWALRAGGQ